MQRQPHPPSLRSPGSHTAGAFCFWEVLNAVKRGDRIAVLFITIVLVAAAVLGYFVAGWMFGNH
jgi:hypothetical protein